MKTKHPETIKQNGLVYIFTKNAHKDSIEYLEYDKFKTTFTAKGAFIDVTQTHENSIVGPPHCIGRAKNFLVGIYTARK